LTFKFEGRLLAIRLFCFPWLRLPFWEAERRESIYKIINGGSNQSQELITFGLATVFTESNIRISIIVTFIVIIAIKHPLSVTILGNVSNHVPFAIFNHITHSFNPILWFVSLADCLSGLR